MTTLSLWVIIVSVYRLKYTAWICLHYISISARDPLSNYNNREWSNFSILSRCNDLNTIFHRLYIITSASFFKSRHTVYCESNWLFRKAMRQVLHSLQDFNSRRHIKLATSIRWRGRLQSLLLQLGQCLVTTPASRSRKHCPKNATRSAGDDNWTITSLNFTTTELADSGNIEKQHQDRVFIAILELKAQVIHSRLRFRPPNWIWVTWCQTDHFRFITVALAHCCS